MSRDISAANVTESQAATVRPVAFAELDFASGFVRACTANRTLSFDSDGDGQDENFTGVGEFGGLSVITERAGLEITGVTISLSAVDSSLVGTSLNENYQGRTAKTWIGFLDSNLQLVADPTLLFQGRMNVMDAVDIGKTGTLELSVESRLADWDRPRISRYTNADQQLKFPDDKGMEFVSQMVEKRIVWGAG